MNALFEYDADDEPDPDRDPDRGPDRGPNPEGEAEGGAEIDNDPGTGTESMDTDTDFDTDFDRDRPFTPRERERVLRANTVSVLVSVSTLTASIVAHDSECETLIFRRLWLMESGPLEWRSAAKSLGNGGRARLHDVKLLKLGIATLGNGIRGTLGTLS